VGGVAADWPCEVQPNRDKAEPNQLFGRNLRQKQFRRKLLHIGYTAQRLAPDEFQDFKSHF